MLFIKSRKGLHSGKLQRQPCTQTLDEVEKDAQQQTFELTSVPNKYFSKKLKKLQHLSWGIK
jgi:hypothetical protein